ncbi:hypothetical protein M422DRAFT_54597 [Sphaerobolus stellatus SS14]|uniref:Uncharacterized protein n=1 Tax=Sphaerobolus stellatus (strain SS14) TaxID=990650 RepID=A0A0C9U2T2_SPHS4|nr:hypothetical protein M422DRAFT_54597 [Sphaerobolus stellatus SS14]
MSHQKTLPIQMKARRIVFNRLPEEEKKKWRAKAEAWEAKPLSQKELFIALPKLLFTFGDAVRKHLKWSIFIWAGGLTDTGKPASLREEWYDEDDAETQVFLASKEYQAVDTVFNGVVARRHNVPLDDVQVMLPYRPRIPNAFVPQGVPLLKDMLEYDVTSNKVLSDNETIVEALKLYLLDTYSLVPMPDGRKRKGKELIPPWDKMDQKKGMLDEWIAPGRLPSADGFRFSAPTRMADEDCQTFAAYVCGGEYSRLEIDKVFRWQNQQDGQVVRTNKLVPAKRKMKGTEVAAEVEVEVEASTENSVEISFGPTKKKMSTKKSSKADPPKREDTNVETEDVISVKKAYKPKKSSNATTPKGEDQTVENASIMNRSENDARPTKKAKKSGNDKELQVDVDDTRIVAKSGRPAQVSKKITEKAALDSKLTATAFKVVHKGSKGPQFNGNGQEWFNDFYRREMNLEWEPDGDVAQGNGTLLDVVRFLEGSEVEPGCTFSAFLDISEPPEFSEWETATFLDRIFDSDNPLPYPHQIKKLKDWKDFSKLLLLLTNVGLEAISNHSIDNSLSRLRLGGALGIFGIARALEFLRRVGNAEGMDEQLGIYQYTLKENVGLLLKRTRRVFEREMWRRWTSGSLTEDRNDATKRLVLLWHVFMEANMAKKVTDEECFGVTWKSSASIIQVVRNTLDQARLRTRRCEPMHQVAQEAKEVWGDKQVVRGIQAWSRVMTVASFSASSLVEKFAWIYALHMVGTAADVCEKKWWKVLIDRTGAWLETAISSLNPVLMQQWKLGSRVKGSAKGGKNKQSAKGTLEMNIDDAAMNEDVMTTQENPTLSSENRDRSECVVVPTAAKVSTSPQKTTKRNYEEMGEKPTPGSSAKKIKLELGRSEDATAVAGGESQNIGNSRGRKVKKAKDAKDSQASRPPSIRLQAKQAKPSEEAKAVEVAK